MIEKATDSKKEKLLHALSLDIGLLVESADLKKQPELNLSMSGIGRYQPQKLQPFLGYDQFARWLVLVEWYWLKVLADLKVMPEAAAKQLTRERLARLLWDVTTTKQDQAEKKTKHDILALLQLMKPHLGTELSPYLHFGATSYDIIDTAYALQLRFVIDWVIIPHLLTLDEKMRALIALNTKVIQAGRTHLQTALPVPFSFWLGNVRYRLLTTTANLHQASQSLVGKFSGAVGTGAAQVALLKTDQAEKMILEKLCLQQPLFSTQIAPPETRSRVYFEMFLLSGVLAQLGEDVRILQSSQFSELTTHSSTSSTMAHKTGNPITAENIKGMHELVRSSFYNAISEPIIISDLQRDLTGSCIARTLPTEVVYFFQMILTAQKMLDSLQIDEDKCAANFATDKYSVMGELLHLALQRQGYEKSHELVNQKLVPLCRQHKINLTEAIEMYLQVLSHDKAEEDVQQEIYNLTACWRGVPDSIILLLKRPEFYIGWSKKRIDELLSQQLLGA